MERDLNLTFKEIYEEQSDSIFRFCLTRVSNREQSLDLVQETFLRFWQSLNSEKEIVNTRAFLFTVAHRLIIDWYRKKKSFSLDAMMHKKTDEGETSFDVVDESTKDTLELGAEGRYLVEKLDELEEAYRQPIYLRFIEGMMPQEIGKILGISANAASVRVNRALAELRKITGYDLKENKNSEGQK